ncbi:metallophosphoesterase [Enterococcus faecalis]|uniref:metallophosphoesterase n=1 Tax=Enterococcus sp. GC34 TaxID=3231353 RepID=UPI0019DDC8C1|nr:metallophosphoesterase [Enterococcus faecalis]EGS8238023.1 metallophosphoesterase [Enterococcus faecalis]
MDILHLSDIHFRRNYEKAKDGYKGMLTKMENPLIRLESSLTSLLKIKKIDLVIISGDLTEDGEPEDYAFLKEKLQTILQGIPMIVTLGNHDIKKNFRIGWLNQIGSEQPYNVVQTYPEFHIISLDNSEYDNPDGHMNKEQKDWLQTTLKKLSDKPILLVMHHHLLREQSSMPTLPEAEETIQLLKGSDILGVLTGHTHHPYLHHINGIPYYTVAGMSFVGEDEGQGIVRFEENYGYNLYSIDKGRFIHFQVNYYRTDKLLAKLNMQIDSSIL